MKLVFLFQFFFLFLFFLVYCAAINFFSLFHEKNFFLFLSTIRNHLKRVVAGKVFILRIWRSALKVFGDVKRTESEMTEFWETLIFERFKLIQKLHDDTQSFNFEVRCKPHQNLIAVSAVTTFSTQTHMLKFAFITIHEVFMLNSTIKIQEPY